MKSKTIEWTNTKITFFYLIYTKNKFFMRHNTIKKIYSIQKIDQISIQNSHLRIYLIKITIPTYRIDIYINLERNLQIVSLQYSIYRARSSLCAN